MSDFYDNYLEGRLSESTATHAAIDLKTDVINCAICNSVTDYTPNAATDVDYADVTAYSGITPQTLTSGNITVTDGTFDCSDTITFTAVSIDGSKVVDVLVHYMFDTGASTSPLICFHDGFTSVTPNSGNIVVTYSGSGIGAL